MLHCPVFCVCALLRSEKYHHRNICIWMVDEIIPALLQELCWWLLHLGMFTRFKVSLLSFLVCYSDFFFFDPSQRSASLDQGNAFCLLWKISILYKYHDTVFDCMNAYNFLSSPLKGYRLHSPQRIYIQSKAENKENIWHSPTSKSLT